MNGTTYSVNLAILEIPPVKMKMASTATTMPITYCGMPNAVWKASAIELD